MPSRRGPGPVAAVHRIFIVVAFGCALVYGGWEFGQYRATGSGASLTRSLLAWVAALAIGLYLRSLRGLAAKLTPSDRDDDARTTR